MENMVEDNIKENSCYMCNKLLLNIYCGRHTFMVKKEECLDRPRKRWKEQFQQPRNGFFPVLIVEEEEEKEEK
jgi:hypothetical protein